MPAAPTGEQEDEPGGVVAAAAEFLLQHSDRAWERMLVEHADVGTGHCAACRGSVGSRWPCMLWVIARHTQALARRRAPRPLRVA